jgi:hypothetical protein
MRKTDSFSAYRITDSSTYGFSPEEYSKFKYGSKNLAKKFGYFLAEKFINQYGSALKGKQLVVIPSAFSHIQTASHLMETFFVDKLNYHLFKMGEPPVEQTKIYRTVTYREDYGEMTAEERYNLIKGDKFHIDKSFLQNKVLIFIDDIKITGTHERIIMNMLDEFGINNHCYMLYFAELSDPGINPKIENYLNQHYVKNLNDLDQVIKNETFVFNTRVVKFILNSDHIECISFLNKQTPEFITEMFYLAVGNHYGQFSDYLQNLTYIQRMIDKIEEKDFGNLIQNRLKRSVYLP